MKTSKYQIQSNRKLARDIYEMKLQGDTSQITAPGQFVNIKLEGLYSETPHFDLRLGAGFADDHLQSRWNGDGENG